MLLGRLAEYPTLQWFLREMLVVDEEARVDFVTLEQYMVHYGFCGGAGGQVAAGQVAGGNEAQYQQEQTFAAEYYQQYQQPGQGYEQSPAPYAAAQYSPQPPSYAAEQYQPQPPQAGNVYSAPEQAYIPEESKAPLYQTQPGGYGTIQTERKCHGCLRPIINSLNTENYQGSEKEMASNCCSEQCIQRVLHPPALKPEELVKCVRCQEILGEQRIKMNCGHFFHNQDCVFEYIIYISDEFKKFLTDIPCPKCPMNREDYSFFLRKAFGQRGIFERRKDAIRRLSCVVCRQKDDLITWKCGHNFCRTHYDTYDYCPICDKRPPYRQAYK
jgi:hypothetical protein